MHLSTEYSICIQDIVLSGEMSIFLHCPPFLNRNIDDEDDEEDDDDDEDDEDDASQLMFLQSS